MRKREAPQEGWGKKRERGKRDLWLLETFVGNIQKAKKNT